MTKPLTWDEILERAKRHNKTVICEVERRAKKRYFKIKCDICQNEFINSCCRFHMCSACAYNSSKSNTEEFVERAKNKFGNKYDYSLVKYISSSAKVKIKCNSCNNIIEQRPVNHLRGDGCFYCCHIKLSKVRRKSLKDFVNESKELYDDRYDYSLVEYINAKIKVKILCNKCSNIFEQTPHNHLHGQGCSICKESKGENRVAKYLLSKDIIYTRNKIFKTLKDKNYLLPDFYLEDLNLIVEYDGEGHYKAIFGSTPEQKQKNLETQQRRDKIKDEWAKVNNIPLLRIPYWDFDRIEELLDAFIIEYTKKEIKQLVLEM